MTTASEQNINLLKEEITQSTNCGKNNIMFN